MSESNDSDILADIKALDNALALNITESKSNIEPHISSLESYNDFSTFNDDDYIVSNQDIDETQSAYDINKKLLQGLMLVKNKLTTLMQKCEGKIERLNQEIKMRAEESKKHSRYVLITAGMPYFKDNKDCFNAPKNLDTKLKEDHKELFLLKLPKSSRWSAKDRKILFKAVHNEALESIRTLNFNLSNRKIAPSKNSIKDTENKIDLTEFRDRRIAINQTSSDSNKEVTIAHGSKEKTSKQVDSSNENNQFKITVFPRNFSELIGAVGEKEFDWFKIATKDFENRHSPGECRAMWCVYLHPDIEKKEWTNAEDMKLLMCAKKYNFQDWDAITKELGTNRSAYQCFIRHNTIEKTPSSGRFWNKMEDKQLMMAISRLQIGNYIPWAEVASYLPGRTKQQVYTRWVYRKAPHLTKGRFTYNETYTLLTGIKEYGKNFSKISQTLMPHRTSVQLQSHYQTIMETKKNVWTLSDDTKLIRLHKEYGNDWANIAKHFTSITRTQVRHRYKALVKYVTQGYSITTMPRSNQALGYRKNPVLPQSKTKQKSLPYPCKRISNSDVLPRLFETLSFPLLIRDNDSQEINDLNRLASETRNLYNILSLLDANIDFADEFINYTHLSKKEKQLLVSLKLYKNANSNNAHKELIEKYRYKMFGPLPEMNEGSRFIPPLPFNGYIKPKKRSANLNLNCTLDLNEKFLVVAPTELETFCEASFYIDEPEEIQFEKITKLFVADCSVCKRSVISSLNDANTFLESKANRNVAERLRTSDTSTTKPFTLCDINSEYSQEETDTSGKLILPNHATLLGLKNLLNWKLLYEYQNQSYPISNNAQQSEELRSPEYKRAYRNLKARLLRLFKLPIGLSNIIIEIPSIESIFLSDEKATCLEKPKRSARVRRPGGSKKIEIDDIDCDLPQKKIRQRKLRRTISREMTSKMREEILQSVNSTK